LKAARAAGLSTVNILVSAGDLNMPEEKKTCFVVMGFGEKVDFESGRKLNLDATYKYLIKPAVEEAGLACVRADEIAHSGVIDVPMYKQLLLADVVVADVSTANSNAFYELGVRHALRPYATVVICEDKFTFPFDINRNKILKYKHLGEDIGASEVERFKTKLKQHITDILGREQPEDDSPLYTFLQTLRRFQLPEDLNAHQPGLSELAAPPAAPPDQTHSALMEQVAEARRRGDFVTAKALLTSVRTLMKGKNPDKLEDPYIIQQLALATYKSGQPTPQAALEEARDLLLPLVPATSNDTETLGLWAAVHKRLWNLTKDRAQLDEAVRAYERGFYLRNDYYNGINLAYVLNVRADHAATRAEAIADFVQAGRVRQEVIDICRRWLEAEEPQQISDWVQDRLKQKQLIEARYWVMATLAEAYAGIGDETEAQKWYAEALKGASVQWMREMMQEQGNKLRELLSRSPLKYVKEDGE
jgi:hypothetical protein